MYLIYIWINNQNGKVYIGKTNNLERRTYQHWYSAKKSIETNKFTQALKKYSNETDWVIKILEENIPLEKIKEREDFWIKKYNSIDKGYNSKKSGASNKANKNDFFIQMRDKNNPTIILAEFIDINEAALFLNKGYTDAPNILACCKKNRWSAYNYCWSFSNDTNWLQDYYQHKTIKTGPKEKAVQMCNKNNHSIVLKEFNNKQEIKNFLNRQEVTGIYGVLKGTNKSAYGYYWQYKK